MSRVVITLGHPITGNWMYYNLEHWMVRRLCYWPFRGVFGSPCVHPEPLTLGDVSGWAYSESNKHKHPSCLIGGGPQLSHTWIVMAFRRGPVAGMKGLEMAKGY